VILVSGPTALEVPSGVEFVPVGTAREMHDAVKAQVANASIVVMAAAVADYRPIAPHAAKMKRGAGLVLELEPTPDILADASRLAAQLMGERILVGFAAETGNPAESAKRKLATKSVDMIVANDVTAEGAGFDHDTNVVTIHIRDGAEIALPRMSKFQVAQRVLDEVVKLRQSRGMLNAPLRNTGS
jgi:phosphopantothenoylcysteine decarboxylase/phosphopantothenate--cysteine ligase